MSRIRNWQQRNHLSRDSIIHKCARNPKTKKDRIIKQYRYMETMISLILISGLIKNKVNFFQKENCLLRVILLCYLSFFNTLFFILTN